MFSRCSAQVRYHLRLFAHAQVKIRACASQNSCMPNQNARMRSSFNQIPLICYLNLKKVLKRYFQCIWFLKHLPFVAGKYLVGVYLNHKRKSVCKIFWACCHVNCRENLLDIWIFDYFGLNEVQEEFCLLRYLLQQSVNSKNRLLLQQTTQMSQQSTN